MPAAKSTSVNADVSVLKKGLQIPEAHLRKPRKARGLLTTKFIIYRSLTEHSSSFPVLGDTDTLTGETSDATSHLAEKDPPLVYLPLKTEIKSKLLSVQMEMKTVSKKPKRCCLRSFLMVRLKDMMEGVVVFGVNLGAGVQGRYCYEFWKDG